jgi:hypothetical protein
MIDRIVIPCPLSGCPLERRWTPGGIFRKYMDFIGHQLAAKQKEEMFGIHGIVFRCDARSTARIDTVSFVKYPAKQG